MKRPAPKATAQLQTTIQVLGAIDILSIVLPLAWVGYLSWSAHGGASGTEFMALFALPVVAIGLLSGIATLVIMPKAIRANKLTGRLRTFAIACSVLSALLISYVLLGGVSAYTGITNLHHQSQKEIARLNEIYRPREISVAYATQLLSHCNVHQFYYGDALKALDSNEVPAKSATGVLLMSSVGGPWRISIAPSVESQLVPLAQQQAGVCADLTLSSDLAN